MLFKLSHKLSAKLLTFSNISEPPPFVKYSFIASQFFIIKTAPATIAPTAIPTGPVMAVNPAPIKGNNFNNPPKASIIGPTAAAIPATTTIIFFASGDKSLIPETKSFRLVTIGVITGRRTSPSSVVKFVISVFKDLIAPLAPSASLAACPCAAPVCSQIKANVAPCLACNVISPLTPTKPNSNAFCLIKASLTAIP